MQQLKQDFETKFTGKIEWQAVWKKTIKSVITYMPNYSLFVELQILGPNLAKERMMKILQNRHWIHNEHNTPDSCASKSLT